MKLPLIDLHCDLLMYLEKNPTRTARDPDSQCSIPQMQKGGVVFQTMAIFTETGPGSAKQGALQASLLAELLRTQPELHLFDWAYSVFTPITIALAVENASGFLEEGEKLDLLFERLDRLLQTFGSILYLSLTWNEENRFGGGNATKIGLKEDGKKLLHYLADKQIAIDLSHTSDWLAQDILNYLDKHHLSIKPIASHSNFRAITPVARNLPDEIAKEIIRRKGVIGINFIRPFIGEKPDDLFRHFAHGIELGGEKHLCFGSDFAPEIDAPPSLAHFKPFYFHPYRDPSGYPGLIESLKERFPEPFIQDLAHRNFEAFLWNINGLLPKTRK